MDGRIETIQVDGILFIEKAGRRIFLVDWTGKELTAHLPLQKLQDMFEPFGFFRCYKSFLVQVSAIRSIYLDSTKHFYNITLNGTERIIQLSRDKYGELRERLMKDGIMICWPGRKGTLRCVCFHIRSGSAGPRLSGRADRRSGPS